MFQFRTGLTERLIRGHSEESDEYTMVTHDLALRIEKSEIDHILAWMTSLQAIEGNPFHLDICKYSTAVAIADNDFSLGPLLNRVLGFSNKDLPHLPEMIAFYAARHQRCRIDVNPYQGTPQLFQALAGAGFYPFRFHSFLYATSDDLRSYSSPSFRADIAVTRITPTDSALWATVWLHGFTEVLDVSPALIQPLSVATARLCEQSGWQLYLATVHGEPAAVAALYRQDGIASLALAGTLPQFRRHGCQTTLLHARITDALAQDCDLIVAQAALGATSQNNMERTGLKIAYTRAFWLSGG